MDTAGSDADMQSYYAARAAEYDAIYRKPERQSDLRAVEAWLAQHFADKRVLEIACGTGYWTQFLAVHAVSVLGLDAAPETLEVARTRGLGSHVEWVVGDAYAPPRTPQAFDAAFAGFWFSHVPRARRTAFLCRLHAALPTGAPVLLLDNRLVAGSSTPISETDAQGDTWQLRELRDGSQHRVLKNFPTEAELHAGVVAAGAAPGTLTLWPHFWAYDYRVPGNPS
ncbi:MAG: class I SAM-dependent methyltransferase [Giesbergeria sp.]